MSIRRQLLNLGGKHTDFRVGRGALDDLPRMLKGTVATPRRAVLAAQPAALERCGEPVRRALVDVGFAVDDLELPEGADAEAFERVPPVFRAFGECGITTEDLIVCLGDAAACGLVSFCAGSWLGGTACALIPTTLDAMVGAATEMRGLSIGDVACAVSTRPGVTLAACDLDLVLDRPIEERGLGLVQIVAGYLAESRRFWERLDEVVDGLAAGDEGQYVTAICDTQTARVNALKATSPSARCALQFGHTTAAALRGCLGPAVPEYLLLAEGMRFEARLAVDAAGYEVDDVFKLDDCLEYLGIEELPFELAPETFVAAIRAERLRRTNRFMLPLPKRAGFIRLASIDDAVLADHAEAYLASRAELLEGE